MGLLDTFTGGKSDEASDALKRAEQYFSQIQTPTVAQLTLPELQKYVEAGLMTPAQAQAYLQTSNAYADQNINQTGTAAQVQALNQLSEVANAGGQGTAQEQAAIENAIQQMNTAEAGQRGAIEQGMAARGTPYALIQAALENQTVGQNAQQAHMDAVNAEAQAYQTALNAMSAGGQLGGQLQGQQNTQANTVAQAANAMQQFNAANQQQNSQFNAANQQAANSYNAQNKQNISNQNVGGANARTAYNTQLPQTIFNDNLQKAQGMAGAATNYGNMQQQQGQQNAGITSGLINLGTSLIPTAAGVPGGAGAGGYHPNVAPNQYASLGYAQGGMVDHDHSYCMANGGICMESGGTVPGHAPFPGDTKRNDVVPIHASPGEAVIPRTAVAQHPEVVASLLHGGQHNMAHDPRDVASLLKAMRAMRLGVS